MSRDLALQTIPRRPAGARVPLSPSQERALLFSRLAGAAAWCGPGASWTFDGLLTTDALRDALAQVVARHEILRTVFIRDNAGWAQRILPEVEIGLPACDATVEEVPHRMRALAREPVGRSQAPQLRAEILRHPANGTTPERLSLLVLPSLLVADSMSLFLLGAEIEEILGAAGHGVAPHLLERPHLPELPVQFADVASWERRCLATGEHDAALAHWGASLAGLPPRLEMPTDHPRPPLQTFAVEAEPFELEAVALERLRALAAELGVRLDVLGLAAFLALLHRYSGQSDLAVGWPVDGRALAGHAPSDLAGLVGPLANLLVIRARPDSDRPFISFLAEVAQAVEDAEAHSRVPFDRIVQALGPPRDGSFSPLVQVSFGLHGSTSTGLWLQPPAFSPFELTIELTPSPADGPGGGLEGVCLYNRDLFEASTIQSLVGAYRTLLVGITETPARRLGELRLIADGRGRERRARWAGSIASPGPTRQAVDRVPIPRRIAEQARLDPDAVALIGTGGAITYARLMSRASNLARALRARGAGPEDPLAVCLPRGATLAAAAVGVLQAGGAYVPLDPGLPAPRLRAMLKEVRPRWLLTLAAWCMADWPIGPEPLAADLLELGVENDSPGSPEPYPDTLDLDNLAYIIFTSGSTGQPKGALLTHRGLANLVDAHRHLFTLGPGDRLLQFSSPSFDAAVWEIFTALTHGATLLVPDVEEMLPGPPLRDVLTRQKVSCVLLTPSILAEMHTLELPGLQALICGGEAMTPGVVETWAGRTTLVNAYGPTEATVYVTLEHCHPKRPPALGQTITEVEIDILDEALRPVPDGALGELWIGGRAALARGYLGMPGRTAERFVPDPTAAFPGSRLYRTGDLVRVEADGRLTYVGRADDEVKWHGFRIEPREIEEALEEMVEVGEAVVRRFEHPEVLAAYVAPSGVGPAPRPAALESLLHNVLPAHMIPNLFVVLEALPRTSSGKVDRDALPFPLPKEHLQHTHPGGPREPTGPLEEEVADLWRQVLGVVEVGRDDDFFALGGSSLQLAEIHDVLAEVPGVSFATLFRYPTVRQLAAFLAAIRDGGRPSEDPPPGDS